MDGTFRIQPADALRKINTGANWFYWLAGLSIANSIALAAGSTWGLALTLGAMQVVDAAGILATGGPSIIAFVINAIIAATVVAMGYAARRHRAVYLTGMVLFAVDSLVFLAVQDWLGVIFHGYVLFVMTPGLRAFRELEQLADVEPESAELVDTATAPVPVPADEAVPERASTGV